jgi:tRNA threonylcarbamoyladenosine biosynthesis protein TsaE
MFMAILISKSPEETFAVGERWGREAERGWVIGLSGDLGAGKTQLVKGLAAGLGSRMRVHSPTFALLNEYNDGRLPLFHLDLYRLNVPEEVIGAGLEEYLIHPDGVAVVEWIERWRPESGSLEPEKSQPGGNRIRLARIETLSELERRITYEDSRA